MDYRVMGVVRRFFRLDPDAPKARSALRSIVARYLHLTEEVADDLLSELIASGYLYQSTVRYSRSQAGHIEQESLLGLGAMGSDIIPVAGALN